MTFLPCPITDRLAGLLQEVAPEPLLWLHILVDHAHGNALAFRAMEGREEEAGIMLEHYRQALDCLLRRLAAPQA